MSRESRWQFYRILSTSPHFLTAQWLLGKIAGADLGLSYAFVFREGATEAMSHQRHVQPALLCRGVRQQRHNTDVESSDDGSDGDVPFPSVRRVSDQARSVDLRSA